jgi:hypothetical protein
MATPQGHSFGRASAISRMHPAITGAIAGLAGGVVFGVLMAMMVPPMLGMIGSLVGAPSIGLVVHLVFSAIIGAGFGVTFGPRVLGWDSAVLFGLVYGLIWWVLGPLLIMPIWMGMGPMFAEALTVPNLMSLVGHLIYGGITGIAFRAITHAG